MERSLRTGLYLKKIDGTKMGRRERIAKYASAEQDFHAQTMKGESLKVYRHVTGRPLGFESIKTQ